MSEKIAEAINKAFGSLETGTSGLNNMTSFEVNNETTNQQSTQQPQLSVNNTVSTESQFDAQMFDAQQMKEFIDSATNVLNDDSEYNQLVNHVIYSTPFKLFEAITPSSASTSNGSLHTPQINFFDIESANKENTGGLDLVPVKNFTKALETPVKNISQSNLGLSSSVSNKKESTFDDSYKNTSAGSDDVHNVTVVEATKQNASVNNENRSYLSSDKSSGVANTSLNKSNLLRNEQSIRMETNLNDEPSNGKSTNQFSVAKPVFLNQHLKGSTNHGNKKPSFSRLMAQQENIKKSMNYPGSYEVSFGKTQKGKGSVDASNKATTSQECGGLTTTITKVGENSVSTVSTNSSTVPSSSVSTIALNNFETVNNQIISSQPSIISQLPQTYLVPPGTTIWDPDTGITTNTANQPLIIQGHYQLCDFQTQITSTSQNVYLPPNFLNEVNNQTVNVSTSMPMISLVNMQDSKLITDSNSSGVSKKASTSSSRPSILSKSNKNRVNSPSKTPLLNGLPSSPTLRTRKEPRKSIIEKRSIPDDDEPIGQSSLSRKRKNESLNNKSGKVIRQADAINDGRVKVMKHLTNSR